MLAFLESLDAGGEDVLGCSFGGGSALNGGGREERASCPEVDRLYELAQGMFASRDPGQGSHGDPRFISSRWLIRGGEMEGSVLY